MRDGRKLARRAALVLLTLGGCGGDAPQSFELSGTVEHRGRPVPAGYITLAPDLEQGNDGPATGAVIQQGRFVTPPHKGVVGGAYRVTIQGYDGVPRQILEDGMTNGWLDPNGQALFEPFETTLQLPAAKSAHKFIVP